MKPNKLKTLKDIESFFDYDPDKKVGIYSKGDLQDTARKHIVKLAKEGIEYPATFPKGKGKCITVKFNTNEDVINWIKHFFNLED